MQNGKMTQKILIIMFLLVVARLLVLNMDKLLKDHKTQQEKDIYLKAGHMKVVPLMQNLQVVKKHLILVKLIKVQLNYMQYGK